jgi:hypothetical protein
MRHPCYRRRNRARSRIKTNCKDTCHWRWCVNKNRQDRGRKHPDSHPNRVRSRHSEFGHSVEDVACKPSLDRLLIRVTRIQPITKHQLAAHERVLGA